MFTRKTHVHESEPLALAYLETRQHHEPETRRNISKALDHLFTFLRARGRCAQDTTPDDVEALRKELAGRLEPGTQENYLGDIKRFYHWLEKTHRLFLNPAADLFIPRRPRRLPQAPTESEIARLLEQPDTRKPNGLRDRAILELLYSTGARHSEIMALQLADLDFNAATVRLFGKGKKERVVPAGQHALHWLREYLRVSRSRLLHGHEGGTALWISHRTHRPLSYGAVTIMLRKHARKAGLSPSLVTPHAFRRACATHLLRHGAHPAVLQQLLGHVRLSTLKPYLRVTITDIIETHRNSVVGE